MSEEGLRIYQGGLMRCCIQTLYQQSDKGMLPTSFGGQQECLWCQNGMLLTQEGIWEWAGAQSVRHYKDNGK